LRRGQCASTLISPCAPRQKLTLLIGVRGPLLASCGHRLAGEAWIAGRGRREGGTERRIDSHQRRDSQRDHNRDDRDSEGATSARRAAAPHGWRQD
jgi:hypothetical protein